MFGPLLRRSLPVLVLWLLLLFFNDYHVLSVTGQGLQVDDGELGVLKEKMHGIR